MKTVLKVVSISPANFASQWHLSRSDHHDGVLPGTLCYLYLKHGLKLYHSLYNIPRDWQRLILNNSGQTYFYMAIKFLMNKSFSHFYQDMKYMTFGRKVWHYCLEWQNINQKITIPRHGLFSLAYIYVCNLKVQNNLSRRKMRPKISSQMSHSKCVNKKRVCRLFVDKQNA